MDFRLPYEEELEYALNSTNTNRGNDHKLNSVIFKGNKTESGFCIVQTFVASQW